MNRLASKKSTHSSGKAFCVMQHSKTELTRLIRDFEHAFEGGRLTNQGVKPPAPKRKWALALLWKFYPQRLSHDDISTFYSLNNLGHYDRQARQLTEGGWWLSSSNKRAQRMSVHESDGSGKHTLSLVSKTKRNPHQKSNRLSQIKDSTWNSIVQFFEKERGGCAHCGRKCDTYDKGHLKRHLPLIKEGSLNSVPLCCSCNNWFQAKNLDVVVEPDTWIARPMINDRQLMVVNLR